MSIADKPHGRTRYNQGCRCGECRAANREHSRRRRSKRLTAVPPADESPLQPELAGGAVAHAVRAQLADTAAAQERPGLYAVALKLAELLDNSEATPQHPAAAGRLVELLGKLAQEQRRGGRLAAVRSMVPLPPQ